MGTIARSLAGVVVVAAAVMIAAGAVTSQGTGTTTDPGILAEPSRQAGKPPTGDDTRQWRVRIDVWWLVDGGEKEKFRAKREKIAIEHWVNNDYTKVAPPPREQVTHIFPGDERWIQRRETWAQWSHETVVESPREPTVRVHARDIRWTGQAGDPAGEMNCRISINGTVRDEPEVPMFGGIRCEFPET